MLKRESDVSRHKKIKEDENMNKVVRRLIALLLMVICLFSITVTAFAGEDIFGTSGPSQLITGPSKARGSANGGGGGGSKFTYNCIK